MKPMLQGLLWVFLSRKNQFLDLLSNYVVLCLLLKNYKDTEVSILESQVDSSLLASFHTARRNYSEF